MHDKVSTRALPASSTKAWWRPQVDEDDPGPPSCYQCGGLANRVCRNCASLFCPDHGRGSDLCSSCARSSWMAIWIILCVLLILVASVLLTMLLE